MGLRRWGRYDGIFEGVVREGSEVGGRKYEVGSRKDEVGGRKYEVGGLRFEVLLLFSN